MFELHVFAVLKELQGVQAEGDGQETKRSLRSVEKSEAEGAEKKEVSTDETTNAVMTEIQMWETKLFRYHSAYFPAE